MAVFVRSWPRAQGVDKDAYALCCVRPGPNIAVKVELMARRVPSSARNEQVKILKPFFSSCHSHFALTYLSNRNTRVRCSLLQALVSSFLLLLHYCVLKALGSGNQGLWACVQRLQTTPSTKLSTRESTEKP